MKLNKVFKKTVLTSMSVLIAATLSFTGCSNGSSDSSSSDVAVRTVSTFTGIPNYVYGKAETEDNFEGYQSREKNLVKKSFFTSGAIIKTKITGKFATENYTPSSDAKMSFAFIDTSAAANYWADITSGCDVKISDCLDPEGNATFEFTNTVTGSVKGTQEDILFFLHSDDQTVYNASGRFIITNANYTIEKDGSNNSGDDLTPYDLGLTALDGWEIYEVSAKTTTGATISYTTAPAQYKCCGADITFGTTQKVTFTVKNNKNEAAWLQIAIKKDEGGIMAIKSAKINGTACGDVTWGAATDIPANGTVEYEIIIDNTKGADKFVVSFNSNKETNPSEGSITISNAKLYK